MTYVPPALERIVEQSRKPPSDLVKRLGEQAVTPPPKKD